jgi:DNA-binding NarL/FixJ family response regulator
MSSARSVRQGDLPAALRILRALDAARPVSVEEKRQSLALYCRALGALVGADTLPDADPRCHHNGNGDGHIHSPHLSPRLRQTLDRLLAGDSEKQIAQSLSLSQNTIHVYIKQLYRRYEVSSRGELLSQFVKRRGS